MPDHDPSTDLPYVSIALAALLDSMEAGGADLAAGQTTTTVDGAWLPDR